MIGLGGAIGTRPVPRVEPGDLPGWAGHDHRLPGVRAGRPGDRLGTCRDGVVHPDAGAFGAVAQRYVGPFAGFLTRWTYWTIQVIATGGEVIAAGIYLRFWWPQMPLVAPGGRCSAWW